MEPWVCNNVASRICRATRIFRLKAEATRLLQMKLLSHEIRFRDPRTKIIIDVTRLRDSKCVQVIAGRERLHLAEARMVQSPGENDMSVEPVPAGSDLRERHAHLKRDACFFRKDSDRTVRSDDGDDLLEERADDRGFAAEVMRQRESPAGMRLIAVGEYSPARAAAPEGQTQGASELQTWNRRRESSKIHGVSVDERLALVGNRREPPATSRRIERKVARRVLGRVIATRQSVGSFLSQNVWSFFVASW